jgi:hypothetical protein
MGTRVPEPDSESGRGRPPQMAHPDSRLLERFLRGESTRRENMLVVRHLLTGCRQCRENLLPLWRVLAEESSRPESGRQEDRRAGDATGAHRITGSPNLSSQR